MRTKTNLLFRVVSRNPNCRTNSQILDEVNGLMCLLFHADSSSRSSTLRLADRHSRKCSFEIIFADSKLPNDFRFWIFYLFV